jgi:Peroxiredoxin
VEKKTCFIQLEIDGFNKGDIIVFTTIQTPIYEILSEDTLYVTEPNRGSFSKELTNTTCISIKYQPLNTDKDSYSFGTFLVKQGDSLHLHGAVTDCSTIVASGGFYNDSIVARLEYMEKSKDTTMSEELKELRTYMMKEVNDSEYAVYLFLDNLTYVTYDELCARFDNLEPHIKTSYMGQCLNNTINTWASLQPGKQAPDFTVIDISENVLNLSDYKGQYLLVYCWDFCPTTFQVQKGVIDLYQRFSKGRFAILAFTPDDPKKGVSGLSVTGYDDTDPVVVNMRQQFLDQLVQLWPLVYTNHPENHFMKQKYYICNSTMLTFIAPDGKIIARSYFTDLEEVLQTIERTLQQEMPNA